MKSTLRQGNYGDLNVYMLSNLGGGLLGVCPFPTTHNGDDDTFKVDGCMVQASSMPGGDETNFNMGGTAVHEIGHWFGLLHVFQVSLRLLLPMPDTLLTCITGQQLRARR